MPLIKRNKHKNAIKRAIKRRLIEISIRVDGYIYRNKPITVEEAEKYINEISLHQKKCNNDKHVLQVIEKLTRCMKTIIGNTTKNQKIVTLENNLSGDFFPESSPPKNEHGDNKEILDNCNNIQITREDLSESRNHKSNTEDTIEISDSDNDENTHKNFTKFSLFNAVAMEGSAKFNLNENNNEAEFYNRNTICMDTGIITFNNMNEGTNQVSQTNYESGKNNENLEPNETNCTNIVPKTTENMNGTYKLVMANNDVKQKKKFTRKQTSLPLVHDGDTRNSKKKNTSEFKQKAQTSCPTLNVETAMNSMNTNAQNKNNIVSKKNKSRVSQKNVNNALPKVTHKRGNPYNNNKTETCKFKKHKQVDITSNEVSLPVQRAINTEIRDVVFNQDSVTKQMDKLTIDNEYVHNDLSWIEGIRYVREIGTDEFDERPNRFNEVFWDNCLLPQSWNDDDFL